MRRGINKIFVLPCERYLSEAKWVKDDCSDYILCTGIRAVRAKRPRIDIAFQRDIMKWPRHPPRAWCNVSWVRRDIDWHVFSDGGLCWCLKERWQDHQEWPGKSRDAIATDGLKWMFASVDLLLERHLVGHYRKLEKWPEEWTAWGHGTTGVREYERERNQRRYHRRI